MSTDGCCDRVMTVPLLQFPLSLSVWLELNVNTSSIIMMDMNYYRKKHISYGFGGGEPKSIFI